MIYFYWFLFFFLLVNIRAINRSVGTFTLNTVFRFFGVPEQPKAPVTPPRNSGEQAAFDRIEALYKDMKK